MTASKSQEIEAPIPFSNPVTKRIFQDRLDCEAEAAAKKFQKSVLKIHRRRKCRHDGDDDDDDEGDDSVNRNCGKSDNDDVGDRIDVGVD